MRNNIFFSLLFIFCSHFIYISYAQDKTTILQDTIFAVQYFQTGDSLLTAAEYDSSLYNFQKEQEIYEQINIITEKKLQFNPSTKISYQVPDAGNVEISVFNSLGEKVVDLLNEQKEAGYYEVEWNASNPPSGIYFYRMKAGEFSGTFIAGFKNNY